MTILVSPCLLGVPCRYDGQSKAHPLARALCEKHHVVPVCGEIFGGLPTPRTPAEIQGDQVVTRDGRDVTEAYRRGAEAAAQLARLTGAQAAVLKERSPSCCCTLGKNNKTIFKNFRVLLAGRTYSTCDRRRS